METRISPLALQAVLEENPSMYFTLRSVVTERNRRANEAAKRRG